MIDLESLLKTELPQLPNSALRVTKVAQDENASTHKLVEAIGSDPVLTARIIRASNSALYARTRSITSLPQAVNTMGIQAINQLVLTYAAADAFNKQGQKQSLAERTLWRHSVAVGTTAREICVLLRRRSETETAFLCGLLHDIGRLLLLRHDPTLMDTLDELSDENQVIAYERETYGYDHAEVGAQAARRWQLAEEVVYALLNHHTPLAAKNHVVLTHAINAADRLATLQGMGARNEFDIDLMQCHSVITLGLTEDKLNQAWDKAQESLEEMMNLLSRVI